MKEITYDHHFLNRGADVVLRNTFLRLSMDTPVAPPDLSQWNKFTNNSIVPKSNLVTVNPLTGNVVEKIPSNTEDMIVDAVTSESLLGTVIVVALQTAIFHTVPARRPEMLNHLLTLMIGEVGATLDPLSSNPKLNPTHYGLLQQSYSNWCGSISVFSKSVMGQSLLTGGIIANIAMLHKISPDDLLNPVGHYGPNYLEIYQLIPILGSMMYLIDYVNTHFQYQTSSGWTPLLSQDASSSRWKAIQRDFAPNLLTFAPGRQMLLTLFHVHGTAVLNHVGLLPYYSRLIKDPLMFQRLWSMERLRSAILLLSQSVSIRTDLYKISEAGDVEHEHFKWQGLTILSPWGPRVVMGKAGFHKGVDIQASYIPIYAIQDGIVKVGYSPPKKSYGTYVTITHPNGVSTIYAHLSKVFVNNGDQIKSGTKIGISGNTGRSTGAHLHLSVIYQTEFQDPLNQSYVNVACVLDPNNPSARSTGADVIGKSSLKRLSLVKKKSFESTSPVNNNLLASPKKLLFTYKDKLKLK